MNPKWVHTETVLEQLFGITSARILLHLFHYGEIHIRGIAADYGAVVNPFKRQLDRLELTGLLVSKKAGRTRLYQFNPKSPFAAPVKKIVEIAYESLPLAERQRLFSARRRPRRKGKPVR